MAASQRLPRGTGIRVLAVAPLLSLALVLLAGCGGPPTPGKDAQGRYVIHMTDSLRFSPATAHVPLNATVVWINDASVGHDVQGGEMVNGQAVSFSSGGAGGIAHGKEYAFTFPVAGTYDYYCLLHHSSGMQGTLTVG